jgi:carboxyl-terminal processing protease
MKLKLSIICILLITIYTGRASDESYYYNVNKAFDIYGSVFREIAANYVLDTDPMDLIKTSIDGMLSTLDPYTVYYEADEGEDIDVISNGTYVGFGIAVGERDSMLTIVGIYDGYSAQKNGLRIGDRIYKIDTAILIHSGSDELRKYTHGKPNTTAKVWILRDGVSDTIKVTLQREEIAIKNVPYFGIVKDSVGYIRLDRFSKNSAEEVRSALTELKHRMPIKGLILDLRGNPGGLLEAAVGVSEIFVPKGSLIVSTRGRNKAEAKSYISHNVPDEPNLPLAVLIDGMSASASEIVAGAIQDLDRGIIIGNRSYGKGLVQTVFDMPFNTALKLTTAKYYTPSGRCIQKIDYSHKKISDSTRQAIIGEDVFKTSNGRRVYEYGGILPDSIVRQDTLNDYVTDLLRKNMIFNFANIYSAHLASLGNSISNEDKVYKEFRVYLGDKDYIYESKMDKLVEQLISSAKQGELNQKTQKLLADVGKKIKTEEPDPLSKNKEVIEDLLNHEIFERFNSDWAIIENEINKDNYISVASSLLKPENYGNLLEKGIMLDK